MALIEIRDLTKRYHKGGETITPLDNVTLDIEEGEFVSLMGASGSGKSTLLNLVASIDRPGQRLHHGRRRRHHESIAYQARSLAHCECRLHIPNTQFDSSVNSLREHRASLIAAADES